MKKKKEVWIPAGLCACALKLQAAVKTAENNVHYHVDSSIGPFVQN